MTETSVAHWVRTSQRLLLASVLAIGFGGAGPGTTLHGAEPSSAPSTPAASARTLLYEAGQGLSAAIRTSGAKVTDQGLTLNQEGDLLTIETVSTNIDLQLGIRTQAIVESNFSMQVALRSRSKEGAFHEQSLQFPISTCAGECQKTLAIAYRGCSELRCSILNAQGVCQQQYQCPLNLPQIDQIELRLVSGTPANLRIVSIATTEAGFRSLFNGRDLSEWELQGEPQAGIWSVDRGEICCSGKKGAWLRTRNEVQDFHLKLEYQMSPGGNSGLYVRVPKDGNHHRENASLPPAGLEIQFLDDGSEKYRELKPYQYSASLYDIVGADPRVSRRAGEWNTFEVAVRDQHYRIWHNGILVIDTTPIQHPSLGLRKTSGFLGLQNHSSVVRFRNLRIGPPLP